MTTTSPKLTNEWRARLTLSPETICTITSTNRNELEDRVRSIFRDAGPVKITQESDRSYAVYHPSYLAGNQPLGHISEMELPEHLSVRSVITSKMQAQSQRAA